MNPRPRTRFGAKRAEADLSRDERAVGRTEEDSLIEQAHAVLDLDGSGRTGRDERERCGCDDDGHDGRR
jgi:hypothetical protein